MHRSFYIQDPIMFSKLLSQAISAIKKAYPITLIPDKLAQLIQNIITLETLPQLTGRVIAARQRSYEGNTYNISVECTDESSAHFLQQQLEIYFDSGDGKTSHLKATSVGTFVDIMTSPGGFYGKGVALFQIFQFHPTISKENIYIIDDSAYKGGNGVAMMVDVECQCFCVGTGVPAFPHIQTSVQGKKIQGLYADGTSEILEMVYTDIKSGKVAGNETVFLLDVDATLTMKGKPDDHMDITEKITAQLSALMEVGAHVYLCTARGLDLLTLQSTFFKNVSRLMGIFQMNGTHYTSGRELTQKCQKEDGREFSALTSKYKRTELYVFSK
jgi:hypothetical protein